MLNQFELMRIFCAAAEARSFREAAAYLRKSPQAVTRAIKELEALRGEILFYRSTRSVQITREGELLAKQARALLDNIDLLVRPAVSDEKHEITGMVSITMPASLGRHFVMPVLSAFQRDFPAISLRTTLTDTHSDVVDEQIDIGIRTGFLRDSRYVFKKIRDIRFYMLGAPALIEKYGNPALLTELEGKPVLALEDSESGRYWSWRFQGIPAYRPDNPAFITNDLDAYQQALLAGMGFGQLADYLAEPLLRENRVDEVLKEMVGTEWGLYLYRPQGGPVTARVRLLFDYLYDALKPQ